MPKRCPICGGDKLGEGLGVSGVPAHTVVLHKDAKSALETPRGDINLACCKACGFVFNRRFEAGLLHYTHDYESTQSFSGTFNAFNESLVDSLLASRPRIDGDILEIGCGQGEFLALLEAKGCTRLIGFDPAYDPARSALPENSGIMICKTVFAPEGLGNTVSMIICKMTLEHIAQPQILLGQIAELAKNSPECEVFIQVPNAAEAFEAAAFWDVYYEHCNYFTAATLARALRDVGLPDVQIETGFNDQYLLAKARASKPSTPVPLPKVSTELARFAAFSKAAPRNIQAWRDWVTAQRQDGKRIAIWGGGSKAVSFCAFTGLHDVIECVIDINPRKSGFYFPGSDIAVVEPTADLAGWIDVIILMNPVYLQEVSQICASLGIDAEIFGLSDLGGQA